MSYNFETIEYDILGNPLTYRNNDLSWSHGRQLDRFNDITYKYNADGIRISKTINGVTTQYYLDGTKILAQSDGNMLLFHYGNEGVVGFTYQGVGEYYYKKNIFGDIIGIIDANGTEIVKYVYDAWGNHKTYVLNNGIFVDILVETSYTQSGLNNKLIAQINPFRYRSYYYDIETGLYYLNSRYYDPKTCRFINADDFSNLDETSCNGLNLYIYCGNNPITFTDPYGSTKWWEWLLFGIGVVLVVAAAVVLTVVSGGTALSLAGAIAVGAAKGALIGAAIGAVVGIAGGAIYSAVTGADMGQSILSGFLMGFGIGAIVGAVIGGTIGGLTYTPSNPTGLSKSAIKEGVQSTLKNSNKMNHIMQPKHNLPNSVNKVGKLMQKTLTKGTYTPYKSVSSVVWKGYQVTYKIIKGALKISDMWFML